ncbi:MAG: histidine phosphatase family protein [Pseudomonadota bacterium]
MAKHLHVLRHAKSSWDEPGLQDRERALNKRGRRDAPRMGSALSRTLAPMSVSVSPAKRAQLTLSGLIEGWPALTEQEHNTVEDLYTFSAEDLLYWICERSEGESNVFIISHNPGLTELVNALVGEPWLTNLPTCGYVQLALSVGRWVDITPGDGDLVFSLFPKQLP